MIKNIILDIGGVLFDDSKENIEKILNKNCDEIYKNAYGGGFKECLLGKKSIKEHIKDLSNQKDFQDINYILSAENLSKSFPLITRNFEYMKKLKKQGYQLYLLSNITEDSYRYINQTINIKSIFNGGVYSYQEGIKKPNTDIYDLLVKKFQLNKRETIFFDDKIKNVKAARQVGIKSIVFHSIEDIKNNIK